VTEQGTSDSQQPIGDPPVGDGGRTVEQVEAEYRARQAGKDRENQTLRDELARYQTAEQQRAAQAEAQRTAELGEAETLRRQLAEERAARVIDTRRARFPNAADALEDGVLAAMDEAKLAALETRLAPRSGGMAGYVDPASPPRNQPNGVAAPKTEAELRADLARLAPEFVDSLNR
jgi:hypothetical protein